MQTCGLVAGDDPVVLVSILCDFVKVVRNEIRPLKSLENFAAGRRTEVAVIVAVNAVEGSNVGLG